MIVVADTSPLNYLIRLGRPDVLREIYGRVLVPHAVWIQTTLDLYTQEDSDETRAAQGEFLQALGMRAERVQ
jgi:predicted nucleic acid-binding protein